MIHHLLNKEIQDFIIKNEQENPAHLLLTHKQKDFPIKEAVEQIVGRKVAKSKIPAWYEQQNIIYPPRLSMEQCSSQATASYKANLVPKAKLMVDLTGGIGVDFYFLAQKFDEAHYVEQQEWLCEIGKHNFPILMPQKQIRIQQQEAAVFLESWEAEKFDLIYIDPARRGQSGEKVFKLQDCQPDITQLQNLLKAKGKRIMIKLSPMLDLSECLAQLAQFHFEVHIVALKNEVKEMLLLSNSHTADVSIFAVDLAETGTILSSFQAYQAQEKAISTPFSMPKTYLYEPSAAVLKSGLYKSVANRFGLEKLHPNSHLYTSDFFVKGFPGRSFQIDAICSVQKKALQKHLNSTQANLSTRNFPMETNALKKKLNIHDGGNQYLFATTLMDESKQLLICEKIS